MLEATPDNSPARYYRNFYLAMAYAAVARYEDADTLLSVRGEPQVDPNALEIAAGLIRTPAVVESPASLPVTERFKTLARQLGLVAYYANAVGPTCVSPEEPSTSSAIDAREAPKKCPARGRASSGGNRQEQVSETCLTVSSPKTGRPVKRVTGLT